LAKCDQCEKEFGSDGALLQHYSSKHPRDSPPQNQKRSEASGGKRDEKKPRDLRRHQGGRGKKKFLLLSVLILIAESVGAYTLYGPHSTSNTPGNSTGVNPGDRAPDIPVSLINGTTTTLSKFYGHTVLIWFVATWCPSCQQGAQLLASQYYSQLRSEGVTLLTVESYNDLGYSGPTMPQFAAQYAGGSSTPGWLFATTTQNATYTYNPQADLDIYYLVGPSGVIVTSGVNLPTALQSLVSAANHLQSTVP
jgi:thiol-disulfide isomerase/thioredoxin